MNMKEELSILITGATGYLGSHITKRALERGHRIIAVIRSKSSFNKLDPEVKEIFKKFSEKLCFVENNLERIESLDDLVKRSYECFRRIDVLINSAAIWDDTDPYKLSYDKWIRILTVNLIVPYILSLKISDHMSSRGVIINLSCLTSTRGHRVYGVLKPSPAYIASKTALNAVTRYLADLLASKGIIVIGIVPSWVEKPEISRYREYISRNIPLRRAADPQEVADLIILLAEERIQYLSGSIIEIPGAL